MGVRAGEADAGLAAGALGRSGSTSSRERAPVDEGRQRGEKDYRWRGRIADPEAEADNGIEPGIPDPDDGDLLDWRDLAAIGAEQARLYALWRRGRLGNKAARSGMILLAKLMDTCERAATSRLAEIE